MKTNNSVITHFIKSNLSSALTFFNAYIKLAVATTFDYNLKNGKSSRMPLVTFKITPECNLNCVMCGQKGKSGTLKDKKVIEKEIKKMVSYDQYVKLTDEISKKAKIFYIWGGEPFLYPNFMELARYMAKKIPFFAVNTNGTHLKKYAKEIVKDRWNGILVSLDGFEESNDAMRGKGTYKRVIDGLIEIKKEKELQKSKLPHIAVVSTITNINYMHLDKLTKDLMNKGLTAQLINLGTYMTEKIGKEQDEYIKKHLGIKWPHWKGFVNGYNEGIDGKLFTEILEKVHSLNANHPIITVPVIDPEKIGTYYSDLDVIVRDKCGAPWFSTNINYDGDVHFCADYPDYIIGNIKKEKLLDIYNNEKAVKFRQILKNSPDGLFPACKRCYQIMLCGRRRKGF